MIKLSTNIEAFLVLLRAGLWEKDAQLSQFSDIDFSAIIKLAEEQSVLGLVAAGLEHVSDVKVPQDVALNFVGTAFQLEQRNKAMNSFIEELLAQLRSRKLYAILMKGQGIAQCYERPLWRSSGDIDLLLGVEDYEKAKQWLSSLGQICEEENKYKKHVEYLVGPWDIELHGSMRSELGQRIDGVIDAVQRDTFENCDVRVWDNDGIEVILPSADNDVIFVFTHILQHFFRGGIGLRQICDWCRLMWTYQESIDCSLLEKRLRKAGLMTEWKAFGALAVDVLGMSEEAMPFYSSTARWKRKSGRILRYILKVGNFGQNRDMSYKERYFYFVRFMISFCHRTDDFMRQVIVFPLDAVRAYMHLWKNGFVAIGNMIRR